MPTNDCESHENLVLFEEDIYKSFYCLISKFMENAGNGNKGRIDGAESMAIVSTINGAYLLVKELLRKEQKDDAD